MRWGHALAAQKAGPSDPTHDPTAQPTDAAGAPSDAAGAGAASGGGGGGGGGGGVSLPADADSFDLLLARKGAAPPLAPPPHEPPRRSARGYRGGAGSSGGGGAQAATSSKDAVAVEVPSWDDGGALSERLPRPHASPTPFKQAFSRLGPSRLTRAGGGTGMPAAGAWGGL